MPKCSQTSCHVHQLPLSVESSAATVSTLTGDQMKRATSLDKIMALSLLGNCWTHTRRDNVTQLNKIHERTFYVLQEIKKSVFSCGLRASKSKTINILYVLLSLLQRYPLIIIWHDCPNICVISTTGC